MKRKRKESCPSPILDDSPKRTKVQAQRKFAQNSGMHSPIITPIRDIETDDLPHASVLPEPVELLPMKRPNTEDFLTFLCFRGTPILPPNLQFFNTASIVADGQVHEIKGDSPKNGPIDIAKCAGSSSEKPFIAFGVRKRADPIVISRQMEKKRRHALAIQALRRKYQEQKMAKIRALTISKLSEKTTNKTLVKTNTIQKTETVTKKNNTLQKTKVIATKHVKVTTQTLKTKIKPRMCLRSFRGKFVQKELPFRPKRPLSERDTIRKRPDIKNVVRTSRNSNKRDGDPHIAKPPQQTLKKLATLKKPLKVATKPRITKSESLGSVARSPRSMATTSLKRSQMKRRILLPTTIVTSIVKPKLRSTTMKKTVISRRKAQQRLRSSITKNNRPAETPNVKESSTKHLVEPPKKEPPKKTPPEKPVSKKPTVEETTRKSAPLESQEVSRRLTRKDSELANKTAQEKPVNKGETKREITKNLEMKREVKIAETGTKKMVKKNVNLKREFSMKSSTKDVKKNVAVQKTSDTVMEKHESGQKVTRDVKTLEVIVKKVVTRKSEDVKPSGLDKNAPREKKSNQKPTKEEPSSGNTRKGFRSPKRPSDDTPKKPENPTKVLRASTVKTPGGNDKDVLSRASKASKAVNTKECSKPTEKAPKEHPKRKNSPGQPSSHNNLDEDLSRRVTRDSVFKRTSKEAAAKSSKEEHAPKKAKEHSKKECPPKKEKDQEFSKKIQELIDTALKEAEELPKEEPVAKNTTVEPVKCTGKEDKPEEVPKVPEEDLATAKPSKESAKLPKKALQNEDFPKNPQKEVVHKETDESPSTALEEETSEELPAKKEVPESEPAKKEADKDKTPAHAETTIAAKKTVKPESSKKAVKEPPLSAKKDETNPKRKATTKREEPEHTIPIASSRPSRKTKEAAAIYMEILSHKLVNESTIDDDNVSIDSFPELPNVKKTEQREIELKAQAKTCKEEGKVTKHPQVNDHVDDKKPKKPVKLEESCSKEHVADTIPKNTLKGKSSSPEKEDNIIPPTKTTSLGKRKSNPITIASDDDSDNEVLQAKIRKSEAQKSLQQEQVLVKKPLQDEEVRPGATSDEAAATLRRQTRRCTQTTKESDSDSSDESFHIDIRVPRKKKVTRSRIRSVIPPPVSVLEKNVDIILEAARVLEGEKAHPLEVVVASEAPKPPVHVLPAPVPVVEELPPLSKVSSKSSEKLLDLKKPADDTNSDESTTSDINLKSLQAKQRSKKLSKTKSSKSSAKSAASFSDSDEEPLAAKLTSKSTRSVNDAEEPKKKFKAPAKKTADKALPDATVMEPKPKRECTKRPSNYLPMLSSSDEDDEPYFHGFNTAKEELNKPKVFVQSLAPSLDLLSKDIGRKGKVNMSNEQIEQWLKDSALAGSSVAKENDAMLKFGEKIPTEIPKAEVVLPPIVPDLKPLDSEDLKLKLVETQPGSSKIAQPEDKPKKELKSPLADRKWIFKKDKKELMPNKNAFSPENECSVYAFGEDNEDMVSTPFRRPSRRPSSTATSRSEDELSKNDDSSKQGPFRKPNPSDSEDSRCFNIPQNPTAKPSKTMVPPSNYHSKRQPKPSLDRFPEPFDDCKYKIPSSPSASSGSSAKLYKKGPQKSKGKAWEPINPVYVSDFPKPTDPAKLVEAPVFHPTDQEFQDPLEYIERIRHKAEQFGICKIVPPTSFKPECKVSDDMRFTAYNQYVHKMLHRWGANFKEFIAIRKYLATQSIFLKTPPLIGGMEIDLPRLYQTVQSLGGLKEVIEKKKWSKVSDHMKIPKSAQDRVTKLDDIYCKYLLPYDTLSPAEREKLFDEVETYWAKKESKNLQDRTDPKPGNKPEDSSEQDFYDSDDNETEECTVKGKNMALNAFYRIARNTMSMYFKVAEPTASEVEQEFWRYVTQKQNHICVHSASIDCGTWGYGFAVSKNSPFARHAWNLKVLSNNSGSVLRSLGPVMGVTIPTLHVGMVFSACCWYRDPHGLPWVEYLHTGGNKIWYGIPSSSCEVFHAALQKLVPNYCRDKELWLPSDTAMVPPGMLMEHNVSLCRTIQEPGQFIVVFPKVFTSSISTGYVVSESVYFAPLYWLRTARNLFNDLKTSCEPSMFSLDKLLISISNDARSSFEVLRVIAPFIEELCASEKENRLRLRQFGKIDEEKVTSVEPPTKKKKIQSVDGDFECEICRTNLFVSMVIDTQDDLIYCLEDAVKLTEKNGKLAERLKLRYSLDEAELDGIPKRIQAAIETKLQKKVPGKYAGLSTSVK